MKKAIFCLLLLSAISANAAATLRAYNFSNVNVTFRVVRTGANPADYEPGSGWDNIIPGGMTLTTPTGAGNFYQVRTTSGGGAINTFPASPMAHGPDLFNIYFGTNECVEIDMLATLSNTTQAKRTGLIKINGTTVDQVTLWPVGQLGSTYSRTVTITVCSNGYMDKIEYQYRDYRLSLTEENPLDPPVLTRTNLDETIVGVGGTGYTNWFMTTNQTVSITNPITPWQNNSNSFINFNGTGTGAARDDTLKSGFNTLASQLDGIRREIEFQTLAETGSSGTNGSGDNSGVIDAVNAFHTDNTNLLGQINRNLTNSPSISGTHTNLADAQSAADSIMGSATSSGDSLLDSIGTTAPGVLTGGDSSGLTISLVGFDLNLDPEHQFPGLAAFFKNGISLIALLILARYMVGEYKDAAKVYASSQTGGVPAVGPWGSVGLGIAIITPTIIVGLWVVIFATLFTIGLNQLGVLPDAATAFNSGNTTALYLINLFFPISLLMTCAWTRIYTPILITKLVIASHSVQRFLLGK